MAYVGRALLWILRWEGLRLAFAGYICMFAMFGIFTLVANTRISFSRARFADTSNPDRPPIHSHMLRKRAFTAAWEQDIDPRKAAIAYGCNVDTLMKHYVALDEQQVTDDVFAQMAKKKKP